MAQSAPQPPESGDAKEDDDVIELQVVRDSSIGGRPVFLTAKRFVRICKWIEKGESMIAACRYESVTYESFRRHIVRNPSYAKRLKRAESIREAYLREFHIANVKKHAPRNLLASLWWLERTDPGKFALRRVDRDTPGAEKMIGNEISEDRVHFYTQIMADEVQKMLKKASSADPESASA